MVDSTYQLMIIYFCHQLTCRILFHDISLISPRTQDDHDHDHEVSADSTHIEYNFLSSTQLMRYIARIYFFVSTRQDDHDDHDVSFSCLFTISLPFLVTNVDNSFPPYIGSQRPRCKHYSNPHLTPLQLSYHITNLSSAQPYLHSGP